MEPRTPNEGNGPLQASGARTNGPRPPVEADPGRRLLHVAITIVGWVVFVYWWIVVLGRVSPEQVRFTGLFLAITLVAVVLLTAAWSLHNLSIFRRKGPRKQLREVKEEYVRDRLGRRLSFPASLEAIRTDPIVMIRLEHEGKAYRPSQAARRTEPLPFPIQNRIQSHESR